MMLGYDHAVVAGASMILGIAGREMFDWVADKVFHRKRNGNGVNGLTTATRHDVQEIFETTLKIDVMPILANQTEILKGISETNGEIRDGINKLVLIEELRPKRRR